MSDLEAHAKFFDTHGSVGFSPQRSGAIKVSVAIVKAKEEDLKAFREFFGVGTVGGFPQYPPYRYFRFIAYAKNAKEILEQLLPYLDRKRHAAELGLEALTIQNGSTARRSVDELKRLDLIRREVISTRARPRQQEYTSLR